MLSITQKDLTTIESWFDKPGSQITEQRRFARDYKSPPL